MHRGFEWVYTKEKISGLIKKKYPDVPLRFRIDVDFYSLTDINKLYLLLLCMRVAGKCPFWRRYLHVLDFDFVGADC